MHDKMSLLFEIKPSSGVPIYRQLIEQVNRLVVSGMLKPGEELPSVRQVAANFEVNPMTISKAYSLLEATGVLERVRGKGMIVASGQADGGTLQERIGMLHPVLSEAVKQARQLGIGKDKLIELLSDVMEDENE